jgi:hypothetical protein
MTLVRPLVAVENLLDYHLLVEVGLTYQGIPNRTGVPPHLCSPTISGASDVVFIQQRAALMSSSLPVWVSPPFLCQSF